MTGTEGFGRPGFRKADTFDIASSPGKTARLIPAEWIIYGGRGGSDIKEAEVIGVQTGRARSSRRRRSRTMTPRTAVDRCRPPSYSVPLRYYRASDSEGLRPPQANQFFILPARAAGKGAWRFLAGQTRRGLSGG